MVPLELWDTQVLVAVPYICYSSFWWLHPFSRGNLLSLFYHFARITKIYPLIQAKWHPDVLAIDPDEEDW